MAKVYSPERLQSMKDKVEQHPLLGQIALIYYHFARGEQDNKLADFVLSELGKMDIQKYYETRLFEKHGIDPKRWAKRFEIIDRKEKKIRSQMKEDGVEEDEFWGYAISVEFGLDESQVEELENIEGSIGDLHGEIEIAARPTAAFADKLGAIDTVMHNFHAGIAPGEILGLDRDELYYLAEFLKNATPEQLGFVVGGLDEPPEERRAAIVAPPRVSPIEGFMPSGRPIRFGDRRPISVRGHVRRRRR